MNFKTDMNVRNLRVKAQAVNEYTVNIRSKAVDLISALYNKDPVADLLPSPDDILGFVIGMEQRAMSVYTVRADLESTVASVPFLVLSDQKVLEQGIAVIQNYCDMLEGEAHPNPMLDQAIGGLASTFFKTLLEDENLSVADLKEGLESQGLPQHFITAVMHRLNVVVAYLAANA